MSRSAAISLFVATALILGLSTVSSAPSKDENAPARAALYFYDHGGLASVVIGTRTERSPRFRFPPQAANLLSFAVTGKYVIWTALTGDQGSLGGNGRATLFRASLTGGDIVALVKNLFFPTDLLMIGDEVYWIDQRAIGRVGIDGSHPERRFAVPAQEYGGGVGDGLASDGKYLYFSRCQTGSIGRVRLDGRQLNPRFLRLFGRHCPQSLAFDGKWLYIADDLESIDRVQPDAGAAPHIWAKVSADRITTSGGRLFYEYGGATGGFVGVVSRFGQSVNPHLVSLPQGEEIVVGPSR